MQEDDDLIVVSEKFNKKPEQQHGQRVEENVNKEPEQQTVAERVVAYNQLTAEGGGEKSQLPVRGRIREMHKEGEYLDVCETVSLVKKVRIPHQQFKGKILGKGGETIKEMRRVYSCGLFVHGAGSSADADMEREKLGSGDPKYMHYSEPLHLRIECTGTVPEIYKSIASVTQILAELFNGQVAGVNLQDREGHASNTHSGHRTSNQQGRTNERYFSNSSFTSIPQDLQSISNIPPPFEQGGSGRGRYMQRSGVQKRDHGDSSGRSHRGRGSNRGNDHTPGGGDFSASFRGGGGGEGNEFSTSSNFRGRAGGNSGTDFSTSASSFRGRGNRGNETITSSLRGGGTEFSTSSSFRGMGGGNSGTETITSFRGRGL